MAEIPGVISKHRFVTMNCRKRPTEDWINDCLDAARSDLVDLDSCWPKDSNVKFHVVVTVERPVKK